jgi:hypothetical protein
MQIDKLIITQLRTVHTQVYWYIAPDTAPALYVVLDKISDVARSDKDTATIPDKVSKMRLQVKIYGSVADDVHELRRELLMYIRTERNVGDDAQWIQAYDTASVSGYMAKERRFYTTLDVSVYYKERLVTDEVS